MNRVILIFCILVCFFACAHLWAGHAIGNGGDAVVCRIENGNTTVELLDFFEAKARNIQIALGAPDLSVGQKIQIVVDRLRKHDAIRADLLEAQFLRSNMFTHILPNVQFPDTKDSEHVFLPEHCKLEQLAIQKKTFFFEDPWITIKQELWDRLDNDHKAGLLLHEFLLSESLENNKVDSFNTRYLTAAFSAEHVEAIENASGYGFFTKVAGLFDLSRFRDAGLVKHLDLELSLPNRLSYQVKVYVNAASARAFSATVLFHFNSGTDIPLEVPLGNEKLSIVMPSLYPAGEFPDQLTVNFDYFLMNQEKAQVLILDHWGTVIRVLTLGAAEPAGWTIPLDFLVAP